MGGELMARLGKSKPVKTDEVMVAAAKEVTKAARGKGAKKSEPAKRDSAKTATPADVSSAAKKVNPKLLETIERRKKAAQAVGAKPSFGRPAGRRGRRPKNLVDYTPEHQEEDGLAMEPDYEGLEYDTGIRVAQGGEDRRYNVDVDFDEELNFDW